MSEKLMTIGEFAKEANVSVRTIQYYDKSGLLKPAAYTEGGNRLYSSKELVTLYQIRGLKYMGLSLEEIKGQIISLDSPEKVLEVVKKQKEIIAQNIINMQANLTAIELLEKEIESKKSVDFAKYAKIISVIQHDIKADFWYLNMMKPHLREHLLLRAVKDLDSSANFFKDMLELIKVVGEAQKSNIQPNSPKGQELAASFWSMVMEVTDGNTSLLPSMQDFAKNLNDSTSDFSKMWKQAEEFLGAALEIYLKDSKELKIMIGKEKEND
ncbi:MAG: MerR family transcriptional regulator [Defluviitaleaceae bacterium]|nr:MerR family transcriptional regulator [Defluviitaleaceae bacterium]